MQKKVGEGGWADSQVSGLSAWLGQCHSSKWETSEEGQALGKRSSALNMLSSKGLPGGKDSRKNEYILPSRCGRHI